MADCESEEYFLKSPQEQTRMQIESSPQSTSPFLLSSNSDFQDSIFIQMNKGIKPPWKILKPRKVSVLETLLP